MVFDTNLNLLNKHTIVVTDIYGEYGALEFYVDKQKRNGSTLTIYFQDELALKKTINQLLWLQERLKKEKKISWQLKKHIELKEK